MQVIARLIHAFWLGSGAFLIFVAAPAAFRALSNPVTAANVVGAMLNRWHYIGLTAPLILLALEWRRARVAVLSIIFAAIVLAAAQVMVDMRIRSMRENSVVPISELSRQDPLRRRFGLLHGVSSMLLLGQVIAAAAVVVRD